MGEELNLDNALTPDQIREAREQYRQVYGDGSFQQDESAATPRVEPAPRLITSMDVPQAPYVEPEMERTKRPDEVEEMRRQFRASQGDSGETR